MENDRPSHGFVAGDGEVRGVRDSSGGRPCLDFVDTHISDRIAALHALVATLGLITYSGTSASAWFESAQRVSFPQGAPIFKQRTLYRQNFTRSGL